MPSMHHYAADRAALVHRRSRRPPPAKDQAGEHHAKLVQWYALARHLTSLPLTSLSVLTALLDSQKELMFDLLGRLEERRNEIQVCALEEDFEEMEPDAVVKEMCGGTAHERNHSLTSRKLHVTRNRGARTHQTEHKNTSHVTRHMSHVTFHTSHVTRHTSTPDSASVCRRSTSPSSSRTRWTRWSGCWRRRAPLQRG